MSDALVKAHVCPQACVTLSGSDLIGLLAMAHFGSLTSGLFPPQEGHGRNDLQSLQRMQMVLASYGATGAVDPAGALSRLLADIRLFCSRDAVGTPYVEVDRAALALLQLDTEPAAAPAAHAAPGRHHATQDAHALLSQNS